MSQYKDENHKFLDISALLNLLENPIESKILLNFYQNQKDPNFNPYILKKVCKNEPANFSLTQDGFLDLRQMQFTPLAEFHREITTYVRLKDIKFFKDFICYKAFKNWKENVRKRKFAQALTQIERNHFCTKNQLLSTFFKISCKVSEFVYPFCLKDIKNPHDLTNFESILAENFEEIGQNMRNLENFAKSIVYEACEAMYEGYEFETKDYFTDLKNIQNDVKDEIQILNWKSSQNKSFICSRLINFVRLIDFYFHQIYKELFEKSISEFLHRLNGTSHEPIWTLNWNFEQNFIKFKPAIKDLTNSYKILFINFRNILQMYKVLVDMDEFMPFRRPIINGLFEHESKNVIQPPKLNINLDDKICNEIDEILNGKMLIVQGYCMEFLSILEFCQSLSNYKVELITQDFSLLKRTILELKNGLKKIHEIEEFKDIEVFRVKNEEFLRLILPFKLQLSDFLYVDLISHFQDKLYDSGQILINYMNILNTDSQIPQDLYEFIIFLRDIEEKNLTIKNHLNYLQNFKEILSEFEILIEDTEYEKILKNYTIFEGLLRVKSSQVNEILVKFLERVEFENDFISEEIDDVKRRILNDPNILMESNCPELMAARIKLSLQDLEKFQLKTELYNSFKMDLKLELSNYFELKLAIESLREMYNLWNTLCIWKELLASWLYKNLNELKVDEIIQEIERILNEIEFFREKLGPDQPLVENLSEEVQNVKSQIPLIILLQTVNLKERHWNLLYDMTGIEFHRIQSNSSFNLEFIQGNSSELQNYFKNIEEISQKCTFESEIEKQIYSIEDSLNEICIKFVIFDENFEIFDQNEEILELFDSATVHLAIIQSNENSHPFKDRIQSLTRKIGNFDEILDGCLKCQNMWRKLHGIFESREIQYFFMQEYKLFKELNKIWLDIIHQIQHKNFESIIDLTMGIQSKLEEIQKISEKIMKLIDNYLEIKRNIYPRLYFLSNEDILQILSHPNDIEEFESSGLSKCLKNICKLIFEPGTQRIIGVESSFGEIIQFKNTIEWERKFENVLKKVQDSIVTSLKLSMLNAKYKKFTKNSNSQIVQLLTALDFRNCIENIFNSQNAADKKKLFQNLLDDLDSQLSNYILKIRETPMNNLEMQRLADMIILVKNQINILENLISNQIEDGSNFHWKKQLLYTWDENKVTIYCTIFDRKFAYGFEYVSPGSQIVSSPQIEKTFFGIALSMQFFQGSLLYGLPGVGKSESIKQLSRALGRFYIDFNCFKGLSNRIIERILIGMCETGCWINFENSDRLDVKTLSYLAQQLQIIQIAKKENYPRFFLNNREIRNVSDEFGVFLTQSCENSKLSQVFPDNLRYLFRPIHIMKPDNEIIISSLLLREGFRSKNLIKIFKNLNIQTIKSVIKIAGEIKQNDCDEKSSIYQALKEIGCNLENSANSDYNARYEVDQIANYCKKLNLQEPEEFLQKILFLFNMTKSYRGIILVGPPNSGKSLILEIFEKALDHMGSKICMKKLFPNAYSYNELFGFYSNDNWTDGIIQHTLKQFQRCERNFLILDGNLDKFLNERLETLFEEENQKIFGSNGQSTEISHFTLILETEDISTIPSSILSKYRIINFKMIENMWKYHLNSKMNKMPDIEIIEKIPIEGQFDEIFNFFKNSKHDKVQMVQTYLTYLKSYSKLLDQKNLQNFQLISGFSFYWTFEELNKGQEFDIFLKNLQNIDKLQLPNSFYNPKTGQVEEFSSQIQISDQIQTIEMKKLSFQLELLLMGNCKRPILITGDVGCGKTTIIKQALDSICEKMKINWHRIVFCPKTCGFNCQKSLENILERRTRRLLSGPVGIKTIIFIDDLGLTKTIEPIELLRQAITQNFLHDRENYFEKNLQNIQFVAAVCSESTISERFLPSFFQIKISTSSTSLEIIYKNYLQSNEDILCGSITKSTIKICEFCTKYFVKCESKFHYLFTSRDIGQVVQNVGQEMKNKLINIERYFVYEIYRVFYDKLCDQNDRDMFTKSVANILKDHLKACEIPQNTIFTHILNENREIEEIIGDADLFKYFMNKVKGEEKRSKPPKFIFKEMILKICQISRIICGNGGHIILLGSQGTGRKTIAKFAARLNGLRYFLNSKFEDKSEERVVYIISHINREKFEEILNSIKNEQVNNVNFVFVLDPFDDLLKSYFDTFPSLLSKLNVIWFDKWGIETLENISKKVLESDKTFSEQVIDQITQLAVYTYEILQKKASVYFIETQRKIHIPQVKFIDHLELFKRVYTQLNSRILNEKSRIHNGLDKLLETQAFVKEMRTEIHELEPNLAQKSHLVEDLMNSLLSEQNSVDLYRKHLAHDEMTAREKATDTQMIAEDAHRDLSEALPALETAVSSLDQLEKKDIQEIKNFSKPPDLVRPDWESAKHILSDGNFLKKLYDFDKDAVTDVQLKKLKVYIENQKFTPDSVGKVSKGAKSICMWVRAIALYSKVFKTVEPKRSRYLAAQTELDHVMSILMRKQGQVNDQECKISNLQELYEKSLCERNNFQESINLAHSRLRRAAKLLNILSSEQNRWTIAIKELNGDLENLVGDCIVSAACIVYFGPFSKKYRKEMMQLFCEKCSELGISVDHELKLEKIAEKLEIQSWISQNGLSNDQLSIENAVICTKGWKIPLIIDPQQCANTWIRDFEGRNNLQVINCIEKSNYWHFDVNLDVSESPILIEDLVIDQIFLEEFQKWIKNQNFSENQRIYITTMDSNPKLSPQIYTMFNVVNFPISRSGLEQILLTDLVHLERAELEYQKIMIKGQINQDRSQLRVFETQILSLLYNYQKGESILDDDDLIKTLNDGKDKSLLILNRLERSELSEMRIKTASEKYLNPACRASGIFTIIQKMTRLNKLYEYSIKTFKKVFIQCIVSQGKTDDFEEKMRYLKAEIPKLIWTTYTRGLFEEDKIIFTFLICCEMLKINDRISANEWEFFIGFKESDSDLVQNKPPPDLLDDFISIKDWNMICKLKKLFPIIFNEVIDTIGQNSLRIRIGEFSTIIFERIGVDPVDKYDKLTAFLKVILIRHFKPEKLLETVNAFIKTDLGEIYTKSQSTNLEHVFTKEINSSIPLIFISNGDPSNHLRYILQMSEILKMDDRLHIISIGAEDQFESLRILKNCLKYGDWIFIQNVHLASSEWLFKFEKILKESKITEIGQTFRLFLNTKSFEKFPISIIRNGLKIFREPPGEIDSKLERIFQEIDQDYFEDNISGDIWRQLVFCLCYFHSTFNFMGKLNKGTNLFEGFTEINLEFAFSTLNWLCSNGLVELDGVKYTIENLLYECNSQNEDFKAQLDQHFSSFFEKYPKFQDISEVQNHIKSMNKPHNFDTKLMKAYKENQAAKFMANIHLLYPAGKFKVKLDRSKYKSISQPSRD